ncbi:hypothetical protein Ppa06_35130 [Planomonospora parontospora subsp. parontospora]|uniref:Uncharacterized protein n=2 Tax=Planomonospora parontospora TaxID=58119 RepID=A0AA37BH12_9ACTN|nr:hypothetical protein [Planomonospora parontospora]GGK71103.1 hypothetical protein GCM10010126_33330 [Planomonospora parontospora]GII09715.1 hypothetical protein Ppa06_35130 [Planomonospora parontospora subsp. parontospora]
MQPIYHEQPVQDAARLLHDAVDRAVHGRPGADALALAGVGLALVDLATELRAAREGSERDAGRTP